MADDKHRSARYDELTDPDNPERMTHAQIMDNPSVLDTPLAAEAAAAARKPPATPAQAVQSRSKARMAMDALGSFPMIGPVIRAASKVDPEAALRGLGQSATWGGIDELVGSQAASAIGNPMIPPVHPGVPVEQQQDAIKALRRTPQENRKIADEASAEYRQGDDAAFERSPGSFMIGTGAGIALGPGGVAKLAKPGLGRAATVGGESAAGGFMSSRGDLSTTEGWQQRLGDAGKAGAAGLGLGVLGEQAARLVRPKNIPGVAAAVPSPAERAYQNQVTTDITKAANPTYSRRAVGDPGAREMVVDLVERRPELNKLRTGPREELAQAAQNVADELGPQRLPTYDKFDQTAGRIGYKELDDYLANQVQQSKLSLDQKSELERGLSHVRGRLADRYAEQKKLSPGIEPTLSHAEAREWVTGLLKQKKQTQGSINETAAYNWRDELHRSGDDFLRERMDFGANVYPELRPDLDRLRPLNKDIASALKIEDVASNAEDLSNWKRKPVAERVRGAVERGTQRAAMGALGGGLAQGVKGAAVVGGTAAVLPPLAAGLTRAGVEALGKLSRRARQGEPTAQAVIEALTAGVPETMVREALAATAQEDPKRRRAPANPNEAAERRRQESKQ